MENSEYLLPDPNEDPWPKQLSIGSGAQTIALLNTVPVWFEIWRTLNGFLNYEMNEKSGKLKKKIMKYSIFFCCFSV
jgi:hypothetical protein